jgi:hypothetical protein
MVPSTGVGAAQLRRWYLPVYSDIAALKEID